MPFEGLPGPRNDITDVAGVEVGAVSVVAGDGPDAVRTGVTAIFPRGRAEAWRSAMAGRSVLNGHGDITGVTWIDEHGCTTGPVMLTGTRSIGAVRDATAGWLHRRFEERGVLAWLPVVGETWDGVLSDPHGGHVTAEHVERALDTASPGPVEQGSVGGGTGMVCFEFKGGNGSASRCVQAVGAEWTVGVHLQTNFGNRLQLTVAGVRVGPRMPEGRIFDGEHGSVVGIVLTDAPLLPHQLARISRRVPLGLARTGAIGGTESGDVFVAISTANHGALDERGLRAAEFLHDDELDPLFTATVEATEEAVIDSMVANAPMRGRDGQEILALPHDALLGVLREHRRI